MIAIDSSVIIDLLADDARTAEGAEASLRQSLTNGPVVVCDVVLAEVTTALRDGAEALGVLEEMGIAFLALEARSAVRAGEMQRRYRQRGGLRQRTVPDFIVGAHALLQCSALITRDASFFRDYFKGLKLIVPKGA
ncbi:MAG: type II toxin-antitoxin system VapC family toxin [Burkholderiales bacterium]|nr:type II toxin-antitoxin system VapC family toxin [Burkholderiales bacterium]MDE2296744.1 type II toxin-antitoxin system VapC family toxin [Burkholderiales bacterium]MDE2627012.1 type II toxin-antitoxin system VapC family toxin [Burkholderiales bacterium]